MGDGEEVIVMDRSGGATKCLPDTQTDGKETARARERMGVEGWGSTETESRR